MLFSPLACLSNTEDIISDPLNLPMNESMSVGAPKHLAARVFYTEPIWRMKSCTSAFTLRIVIL